MINKYWLIAVAILFAIAAVFGNIKLYQLKSKNKQLTGIVAEKNSEIEYYKDEKGNDVARILAVEAERDLLEMAYMDELKKVDELNIKVKNLRSLTTSTTETIITDTLKIYIKDSSLVTPIQYFEKEDEWITLNGAIYPNGYLGFSLEARDSLTYVTHWKRNGLFKAPSLTVDARSLSPYTKILSLQNINVQPRKASRIGVVIYGGYGVGSSGLSPQIGVGVGYNIINF